MDHKGNSSVDYSVNFGTFRGVAHHPEEFFFEFLQFIVYMSTFEVKIIKIVLNLKKQNLEILRCIISFKGFESSLLVKLWSVCHSDNLHFDQCNNNL